MIPPLNERLARYERILAMRSMDPPMTYEAIGATFDPPLGKERVRQILANPPRRIGRPSGPGRREELRKRLSYWEDQRASRERAGFDATYAAGRVAKISAELAALDGEVPQT